MARHHRYSHHVRRSLTHAATLADAFRHPVQDTAHLLVGVMLAEGSIGADVMKDLGLPVDVAGVYLKRMLKPVDDAPNPVPRSTGFEEALEQANDEAGWLGSHYIGTEHLLLGITRTNPGNAIYLLHLVDLTPEQIRRRIRQVMREAPVTFDLKTARANTRLSELSRRVLNAAEQRANLLEHNTPAVGHLLLALAQERRGVTASYLQQSGLNIAALEQALERRDESILGNLEAVLSDAIHRAEKLGSHYVGADHLLLSLALLPPGISLLQQFDVDTDKVARLLKKQLDS